jgi:hypothetical protein
MHIPRCLPSVLTLITAAAACSAARADTFAPASSYKQVTQDGKYVLVMIPPMGITLGGRGDLTEEGRGIREKYPHSGLYRNDGSTDPLWTFDWTPSGLTVASDGVHMVRHGSPRRAEDVVIGFYANGKLLREYRLGELVRDTSRFPQSGSGILMGVIEESRLDNTRLEFTLVTGEGNRYVFDVRNGEVVSGPRTGEIVRDPRAARSWWWLGVLLAVLVVVGLYVWYVLRSGRAARHPRL